MATRETAQHGETAASTAAGEPAQHGEVSVSKAARATQQHDEAGVPLAISETAQHGEVGVSTAIGETPLHDVGGGRATGRWMPGFGGPALVLLIGASGSGKSTLARRHYQATQIVSLDALRAVVADDECDQSATGDAVGLLKAIVAARLSRRLTTVVDATNGVPAERAELIALAAAHGIPVAAVVVDTDLGVCLARQRSRPGPLPGRRWGRAVPDSVVRNQHGRSRASLDALVGEGVTTVLHLTEPAGRAPAPAS